MIKSKKRNTRKSIRFKIVILPLIMVFITVLSASGIAAYLNRESLIKQMKDDGLELCMQTAKQIEDLSVSMEAINQSIESDIREIGKWLVEENNNISNESLKQIARDFNISEINIYDTEGKIIYSNLDENLGYKIDKNHPAYSLLTGEKDELIEDIRKSTLTDDYYKYGYVKKSSGGFVQVGIDANRIKELTERFSYQRLVDELGKNENVVYALFIDKNLKAVAHSNKERIGIQLTDEGSKTAAVNGKPYASEYFYEAGNVQVYDVLMPVTVDGRHIGAINVGLSMERVNNTIRNTFLMISGFGIIIFIIAGTLLFIISRYIVRMLKNTKEHLNIIASGDFTKEVPQKHLQLKDEFGEIAESIEKMQTSIKSMLSKIKEQSNLLNTSSETLAAVSQEMASSSQELTSTMQQVADGASSQANNLSDIVNSISQLTSSIENVYNRLESVKLETDNATDRANIGKQEMDKLILSINEIKNAFEIVIEKVGNLINSVKEISSITEVISGISEQTNLLALNAAIEAARAGEHGKGFAVVAEEVRKLAEESKKSTDRIGNLVTLINNDTEEVLKTSKDVETFIKAQGDSVENTVKSFRDILISVENIGPLMNETYKGMNEIIKSKDMVMERVERVSAVTEENSAASEEVAASSEELSASTEEIASTSQNLSTMAEELMENVNKFKI
jgi:methyl-accepting chemotaxis protein